MNTPKIKLQNISSGNSKPFSTQQKKYLPDNYFTYDIHRHLNTDFHNINIKKGTHINICCFKIVESRPNKIIQKPFLQYLLYKYPKNIQKSKNLCVFPFQKYKSGEILNITKTIIKSLFDFNESHSVFFIKDINPDIKLQTFLILSQLFCIETLISARFDSIIYKRNE